MFGVSPSGGKRLANEEFRLQAGLRTEEKIMRNYKIFTFLFICLLVFFDVKGDIENHQLAAGDLDPNFGTGGKVVTNFTSWDSGHAVALQSDGKMVVSGRAFNTNSTYDVAVVRYNTNGTLDSSFDGDGRVITPVGNGVWLGGETVAIQPDGKIVVAGRNSSNTQYFVIRYNLNGSLDPTFGNGGIVTTPIRTSNGGKLTVIVSPDNAKILVAGTTYDQQSNVWDGICLVRYQSNGTLDSGFGNNGIATRHLRLDRIAGFWGVQVSGAALQFADEKIIVVGRGYFNTFTQIAVARFLNNGTIDTTFGNQPTDPGWTLTRISNNGITFTEPNDLYIQNEGKILVAGYDRSGESGAVSKFVLIRYNSNGTLDNGFGSNGIVLTQFGTSDSEANSVVLQQPDNKIIVGGFSNQTGTIGDFALARYNPNGSLDNTFGTGGKLTTNFSVTIGSTTINGNEWVSELVIQGDGKIVAAGTTSIGAPSDIALARYLGDTANRRALFDYDGDGKTDLSIFRPTNGQWWLNQSTNGLTKVYVFGNVADRIVPADYTGDGRTDVAFFREGQWFVLRSENDTFYAAPFGTTGDIAAPGDFDADGRADLAVFRPTAATWFINRSTAGNQIVQFGANGDVPTVGDYDGDGKADIAIFRPGDGSWWVQRSTSGFLITVFGTSTDKPVPADYTGDGKTDIAFWRPNNGTWYVLRSENLSFFAAPFGANGDTPAPSDFDGDGRTDFAVFRPTAATWFINRSTQGSLIQQFGANGDRPTPAAYIP
jgi:uncharacterized delta-60 repeat protein